MFFWWGRRQHAIGVLYLRRVPPFPWCCHLVPLLPVRTVKENIEPLPGLEVGWLFPPFSNDISQCGSLFQEGGPFGYHHFFCGGFPHGTCELLPLIHMLYDVGEGFWWVVQPHHINRILFQVYSVNIPVGPEEVIHNIQVHDLSESHQLVLDGGQENRFYSSDDLFLDIYVHSGVPL